MVIMGRPIQIRMFLEDDGKGVEEFDEYCSASRTSSAVLW